MPRSATRPGRRASVLFIGTAHACLLILTVGVYMGLAAVLYPAAVAITNHPMPTEQITTANTMLLAGRIRRVYLPSLCRYTVASEPGANRAHMIVTIVLIALTCAFSITGFQNHRQLESLLFWPPAVNRGEYHRLLTHGFMHADGQHLLFNMITLFFFGRAIEGFFERYIGLLGFALFYLAAIVVAILPSYFQHRNDSRYRSLGASGAVSAVLFAYILLAPWSTIYVFFFPIPAIVYAALFTAYGFYAGRMGHDHINHSAHLWGSAFGIAFTLVMEPRLGPLFVHQLFSPGLGL